MNSPAGSDTPASLTVAILDDEQAQAKLLVELLTAIGHNATAYSDPAAAVRAIALGGFDVLLTDLFMGNTTGWQVARRVKALAPEVVVVVVTGWPIDDAPELAAGDVDAILQKPYQLSEIERILAEATTGNR